MDLFKDKGKVISTEDLYREIYTNSLERKSQLKQTFDTLSAIIDNTPSDRKIPTVMNLLPEITKLQQVSVNNDDQLIKLASVVSKIEMKLSKNKNDGYDEFELSDDEKKHLMSIAKSTIESEVPRESK